MAGGMDRPLSETPRVEDLLAPRVRRRSAWPRLLLGGAVLLLLVMVSFAVVGYGTGYKYASLPVPRLEQLPGLPEIPDGDADVNRFVARQKKVAAQASAELEKLAPADVYVVVDQTQNRLYLKKHGETLLEAKCSAGSGMVLKENPGAAKEKGNNPREWIFDTPRGLFKVKERHENPVWVKPVWAQIEEGKIPTKREDFVEEGTLGEYALVLGDGYMIHGTLYERLLGRSVTHGCIRLGREDLRRVWAETRIGTPVYIY
jgi:L,D-transpeptidase ErfK/SrfK